MNERLPLWMYASLTKHFAAGLGTIATAVDAEVQLPGMPHPTVGVPVKPRISLHIAGPRIRVMCRNTRYRYIVQLAVVADAQSENMYTPQIVVGKLAALFTDVALHKYGPDAEDTGDQLGCFVLSHADGELSVDELGALSPGERVVRSTVTALYEYDTEA